MSIATNLEKLNTDLTTQVSLVAVSKTKPVSAIEEAYAAGQRIFGENKVQEMVEKHDQLPSDIQWHMIGHVQRNKVKYMASFVAMIHGVDSYKTLTEINKQAAKHQRSINCLLQVKIAREDTKFGLHPEDVATLLKDLHDAPLPHCRIVGLMGMASFTDDKQRVVEEFNGLHKLFTTFQTQYPELTTLSMGMSGDYKIAIENGSTMIRVGSAIFGHR